MYQKLMHNKSLRLIGGLLGGLLLSVAINVFIVPQGLYGGGAYGLCQVIRTLLQRELSLSLPFDLAGVLYFFVNIPLFLLAYKALGREFFWKAAICTVCSSVFLAVIPSPSTPVIPDLLTSWTFWDCISAKRAAASPWAGSPFPSTRCCTPCASSCSTPPPRSTPLYIMC